MVSELLGQSSTRSCFDRMDRIPRRTRQTIRQRLLSRECIIDCRIPAVAALGRPLVVFAVMRPYTERHRTVATEMGRMAACANLWSFRDSIFGMFVLRNQDDLAELQTKLADPDDFHDSFSLPCDAREASIPVYFDFELAWSKIARIAGVNGYPRGIPMGRRSIRDGESAEQLARRAVGVLRRLPPGLGNDRPGLLSRRSERRVTGFLVRYGTIECRTLLEPIAYAKWASNFPSEIVFIRGRLKSGTSPSETFHHLVSGVGISPFLFAWSQRVVLFAALAGSTDANREGSGPSVSRDLGSVLEQIVVIRGELSGASAPVLHRYDSPFATSGAL